MTDKIPIPLNKSYRLVNHGPTTILSTWGDGRPNAASVAWLMPADFDPPLYLAVISAGQKTHTNLLATRECVINIPVLAQIELVRRVGTLSGNDGPKMDDVPWHPAAVVQGALIDGCGGWIEARLKDVMSEEHGVYLLEAVAATAPRGAVDDRFLYDPTAYPTLHHFGAKIFGVIERRV